MTETIIVNVLTVIAHPNPASFNYGILERIEAGLGKTGHAVKNRDLHAPLFSPVLGGQELGAIQKGEFAEEVKAEQALLEWADGLVFIYPLWWFDRPAVLKGWCDRVFTHGFAFSYGMSGVTGLLKQKKALVLITAGGSEEEMRSLGATSKSLLLPMTRGSLEFCGVENVSGKVFYSIGSVSDKERAQMLDEVEAMGENF